MALPLFAITLFVSAFLLFLVQPMIGKMILPKLGGTPQVWNTCMMFFQTVLLAGYFYTHATTTYLNARRQMILHAVLLLVPIFFLFPHPFNIRESFVPPPGANPIPATLWLLAFVVGIPFFVVSTSAPLLQRWFSFSGHPTANDPYYLYGASNLGSLLSLLAYPFFVEPNLGLNDQQAMLWAVSYVVLAVMILASAALVWQQAAKLSPAHHEDVVPDPLPATTEPIEAPSTAVQSAKLLGKKKGLKPSGPASRPMPSAPAVRRGGYDPQTAPLTWGRRLRWMLLAAVPSSLMLGVTSYVSTDLSPFPLLWVIPLSLYLLSFILVFSKWPVPWTGSPHSLFLYAMPVAIVILCMVIFSRNYSPTWPTIFSFLCFWVIVMTLHGELAKDRPAARFLTEFFLWMSVGGMVGGVFNGLFAPVLFTGVVEYPLAIFLACLMRPNLVEAGWIDNKLLNSAGIRQSATEASDNFAKSMGKQPSGEPFLLSYGLDIAIGIAIAVIGWFAYSNAGYLAHYFIRFLLFIGLPENSVARYQEAFRNLAIYGIPVVLALIVSPRMLRFAVAIGGILLVVGLSTERTGQLYAGRSYFGVLRVVQDTEPLFDRNGLPRFTEVKGLSEEFFKEFPTERERVQVPFNFLMHGSTYHGRNYQPTDLARLATTYYHRFGPVGVIMEKYNWFPGPQNTFWGDARMPASMVGNAVSTLGSLNLPVEMITNVWSEPPYATVGLGTGTMASYCRPFQHLTFYEIDDLIKNMSIPPSGKDPYFRYVKDAMDRGGNVEIVMGDARLTLEKEAMREKERIEKKLGGPTAMRNGYYKVIELDAFSSDAIPVHLITLEAVKLYMDKLAPDGVLMVHTSNRHLRLPRPVADIAKELKLDAFHGNDSGDSRERGRAAIKGQVYSMGHFGSEYVMVARKGVLSLDYLRKPIEPYVGPNQRANVIEWRKAVTPNTRIWTDDYQDIVSILRGYGTDDE